MDRHSIRLVLSNLSFQISQKMAQSINDVWILKRKLLAPFLVYLFKKMAIWEGYYVKIWEIWWYPHETKWNHYKMRNLAIDVNRKDGPWGLTCGIFPEGPIWHLMICFNWSIFHNYSGDIMFKSGEKLQWHIDNKNVNWLIFLKSSTH